MLLLKFIIKVIPMAKLRIAEWNRMMDDFFGAVNWMGSGYVADKVYKESGGIIDVKDTLKALNKDMEHVRKKLNEIDDLIQAFQK